MPIRMELSKSCPETTAGLVSLARQEKTIPVQLQLHPGIQNHQKTLGGRHLCSPQPGFPSTSDPCTLLNSAAGNQRSRAWNKSLDG